MREVINKLEKLTECVRDLAASLLSVHFSGVNLKLLSLERWLCGHFMSRSTLSRVFNVQFKAAIFSLCSLYLFR